MINTKEKMSRDFFISNNFRIAREQNKVEAGAVPRQLPYSRYIYTHIPTSIKTLVFVINFKLKRSERTTIKKRTKNIKIEDDENKLEKDIIIKDISNKE